MAEKEKRQALRRSEESLWEGASREEDREEMRMPRLRNEQKRSLSALASQDLGVLLTASTRSVRFIGFYSHSSNRDEAEGRVQTNLLSFLAYRMQAQRELD